MGHSFGKWLTFGLKGLERRESNGWEWFVEYGSGHRRWKSFVYRISILEIVLLDKSAKLVLIPMLSVCTD
jgi:hypothetical protein